MTRLIPSDAAYPAAASVDLPPAVWIWHGLGRAGHGFPQAWLEALGHVEPAVQPFAAGGVHREVQLPHTQRASKIPLDQLPAKAFDKLVELYAADYGMLAGLYSPAALR